MPSSWRIAEDASGAEAGEGGEIGGSLRVAGAAEDAALFCAERKDVARLDEIVGSGGGIGEDADGGSAIGGADAGGDAAGGIDGDREIGALALAVIGDHALEAELLGAVGGDGDADETAAVHGHEIDGLRGDLLGSHDEIAFVFAVGVIDDDDHAAGTDIGDDVLDGVEIVLGGCGLRRGVRIHLGGR